MRDVNVVLNTNATSCVRHFGPPSLSHSHRSTRTQQPLSNLIHLCPLSLVHRSILPPSSRLPSLSVSMSSVTLPITFRALGSPTLAAPLEWVQRTVTSLEPEQLLVRVSYSSLNAADFKLQRDNRFNMPFPQVLGFDFSGTVVAVGSQPTPSSSSDNSDDIRVGSRVFGISVAAGCFAEYVVARRWQTTLQGDMPDAEASTYGIGYMSGALRAMSMADLPSRAGQTIFLPGAAGGVGHFVVQLAKTYGLRVIASASKPAGLELLRSLGVDVVIDYRKQDVVAEVLAATDGKGADIVIDTVCELASFKQSAAVVRSGGHWLCLGPWTIYRGDEKQQVEALVASRGGTLIEDEISKYWTASSPHRGEQEVQWQIARQNYEAGKVRPHITATVPFDAKQLQAAMDESVTGVVGKMVVKIQ